LTLAIFRVLDTYTGCPKKKLALGIWIVMTFAV